jgi:hypothetical protein
VEGLSGLNNLSGIPAEALGAGAVAIAIAFGAGAAGKKSTSLSSEVASRTATEVAAVPSIPEVKVDLSIPYDSAARLAYSKMNGEQLDEAKFAKFKELYEKKAVADVISKRASRDLALL